MSAEQCDICGGPMPPILKGQQEHAHLGKGECLRVLAHELGNLKRRVASLEVQVAQLERRGRG